MLNILKFNNKLENYLVTSKIAIFLNINIKIIYKI